MGEKRNGFFWPLMQNNILPEDLEAVIGFLQKKDPKLTQGPQVKAFEEEWSKWLGVKYSVFVNSGSSANLATLASLRQLFGPGEVIVPALTWVSDIASVFHTGMDPVFVDIDPKTLGMDLNSVLSKITSRTRAVFLSHILGFNALTESFVKELKARNVVLIEDASESHGARLKEKKVGTLGTVSNFSFYYAHHLTTIEGGMVCTDDEDFYEYTRLFRSHGLVRELDSSARQEMYWKKYPELSKEFIFAFPAYNFRNTEIGAVMGRTQLKRLDLNIERRTENFQTFLNHLDSRYFQTDFPIEGSSNYAFVLILKFPDSQLTEAISQELKKQGVEFRRGTSGGGNQLRQPYLRTRLGDNAWQEFPYTDHVHFHGFYIGNYPELPREKILWLCELLNRVASQS